MAAVEVHHRLPRYLIRAYEDAESGALEDRIEWELEAERYGLDPEISSSDLEELVEGSTVELTFEQHRLEEHAEDWTRWGRLGGLATFERYGRGYFALLARRRWKRIRAELLQEYRARVSEGVAS